MLTSVQKETLQTLINLYENSDGNSVKGEDIAKVMNRNPGTIRNLMISLRSLSLVKGVPGPRGGYKPTIEAYHSLNISVSDPGRYIHTLLLSKANCSPDRPRGRERYGS